MSDAPQHVTPGQTLPGFPAGLLNDLIEVARWYRQQRPTTGAIPRASFPQPCIVPVRNDTGSARSQFDVVQLRNGQTNWVFPQPSANLPGFKAGPILQGITPTQDGAKRLAVYTEAVPAGKIGRAIVCGATVARVNFTDSAHGYVDTEQGTCANLKSHESVGAGWVLWSPGATGVQWAVVVLGVPQWTPPRTTLTVVTAFQIDTVNKTFQIKTRTIDVIDVNTGEESAWTTVHTGTACP